jgi:glucosyl-3-phosphoglycerate synthase
VRIPGNWGLEIGLLAEVYRNVSEKRISQIDLGVFDHKHQQVGKSTNEGLRKMCRDIFRSILRTLTETEQVVLSMEHIHALRVKFRREAQDYTRQYSLDARFNGLRFDRHQEEVITELFEQVIAEAGEQYFLNPVGTQIPDWTRALAVMPDLREKLQEAALTDAAEARALMLVHNDLETEFVA